MIKIIDKVKCCGCSACATICPQKCIDIAEYVIEQGGIVFGVEMQPDYTIKHIAVEEKEDLKKFRNSKYVQSDVGDTYCEKNI